MKIPTEPKWGTMPRRQWDTDCWVADSRLIRAAGLPRSTWGTAVAHFGIALSMLGIIGAATWGTELIVALKPTQTVSLSVNLRFGLSFENGYLLITVVRVQRNLCAGREAG